MSKHILAIDLETYSEVDIRTAGTYKYAENCEILLFAYAVDDKPVQIIDMMNGENIPNEIIEAVTDDKYLKTAYNAAFEINVIKHCLARQLKHPLKIEQWSCTMVLGLTLGLPAGLEALGLALGLPADKQKMTIGKRLIQYFCKPCKPTKANNGRTRNTPQYDIEKWNTFKDYCIRDVESERALRTRMIKFQQSEQEHTLWVLDQKINNAGVLVDMELVKAAILVNDEIENRVTQDLQCLTQLANPNSNKQFLEWFCEKEGYTPASFDKAARQELLADDTLKPEVKRAIKLRDLASKTSVKKYVAMDNMACKDNRVRGMLQFYGAARTGRWAGRGVQLQNLPQNHLPDLDTARNTVKLKSLDWFNCLYENPSDVLSQLIRTAFIAGEGKRFIVADFSAIEARVIAWIADEKWRMEVFAKGGDIYCESATQMFHVPVVKHGINGHLRQKGKVAELACGYGGGVEALRNFGADKMGMSENEMQTTIKHWRIASPNICRLWRDLEDGVKKAIKYHTEVPYKKNISFSFERGILFMTLPSGRRIAYPKPRVEIEPEFDRETVSYMGQQGGRLRTWGGKLTENLIQATARDCLAEAMLKLDKAGYKIVMHVHDEVILEAPYSSSQSLKEASDIMGEAISWAPGLLLRADGYETEFYKKD